MRKKLLSRPWWLRRGSETCPGCHHRHVIQVLRRCVGCDRGVCEHCSIVIWETRQVMCAECARDEATE